MNKKLNKVKRKYSLKVKKQKGGGDFYQTVSKLDGIFITKRRNDNCPEGLDEKTVGTKKICFIRKNDEVQRNDERMDKEKSLDEGTQFRHQPKLKNSIMAPVTHEEVTPVKQVSPRQQPRLGNWIKPFDMDKQ